MVRKRTQSTNQTIPPSVSPERGIELIKRQHEKGAQLLSNRPLDKNSHDAWTNTTHEILVKCFGSESETLNSFLNARHHSATLIGASDAWYENYRAEGLKKQLLMLESGIELLETEVELANEGAADTAVESSTGNDVFLVHGHHEGARETVARLLEG